MNKTWVNYLGYSIFGESKRWLFWCRSGILFWWHGCQKHLEHESLFSIGNHMRWKRQAAKVVCVCVCQVLDLLSSDEACSQSGCLSRELTLSSLHKTKTNMSLHQSYYITTLLHLLKVPIQSCFIEWWNSMVEEANPGISVTPIFDVWAAKCCRKMGPFCRRVLSTTSRSTKTLRPVHEIFWPSFFANWSNQILG